jgi:antitoxin component YwqK of YwqJK toxin-antitoxin module
MEDDLQYLERATYNENGELDGVQEIWYRGELQESWTYRNGVKHGPAYCYWGEKDVDGPGFKESYWIMRNGVPCGKSRNIAYDGTIKKKTYYLNIR